MYFPDKSVSFEKSVSFSDDIHQGAPKSHIPQHPGKLFSLLYFFINLKLPYL